MVRAQFNPGQLVTNYCLIQARLVCSVLVLVSLCQCHGLPLLPDLLPPLPYLGGLGPSLLQTVVSGGGATAGTGGAIAGTTGTVGGAVTTTTVPAMMAMAPILPAVALGIVKAIFISKLCVKVIEALTIMAMYFLDEVIKAMKPKCYGYDCHHNDGYGYGGHGGHHRRHINLRRPFPR